LLLATQRRLASADRTVAGRMAPPRRGERHAAREARRQGRDNLSTEPDEVEEPGEPEEEDLDEPAAADLAEAA